MSMMKIYDDMDIEQKQEYDSEKYSEKDNEEFSINSRAAIQN